MFKAPIKVLHPLLTATQEGNYIGTETLGPIPFSGVILAHSNEAEWQVFKNNKNNEAFLDRICVVTVPYCLRVTEETRDLQQAARRQRPGQEPLRARDARDAGQVLRHDAAQGARELQPHLQDARL